MDVAESWQRGNQPVFVFSSLLAQRQFTAADFALAALNHPDALDNFRAAVTVEQPLFDGVARANITVARIGHEMAGANRQVVDHDLAASVTEAYGRVLVAAAARQSADAAVETARADRELAGNRRDAGSSPTRTSCKSTCTCRARASSRFSPRPTSALPARGSIS